jgi:hypothetical protein
MPNEKPEDVPLDELKAAVEALKRHEVQWPICSGAVPAWVQELNNPSSNAWNIAFLALYAAAKVRRERTPNA